jgi:hypothetical protein
MLAAAKAPKRSTVASTQTAYLNSKSTLRIHWGTGFGYRLFLNVRCRTAMNVHLEIGHVVFSYINNLCCTKNHTNWARQVTSLDVVASHWLFASWWWCDNGLRCRSPGMLTKIGWKLGGCDFTSGKRLWKDTVLAGFKHIQTGVIQFSGQGSPKS